MTVTLLTGATGTLGSALRPRLAEAGHTVRAASRSPADETGGDRERRDAVEWVELDLVDGTGLERALDGVDVVVHAATAPTGDSRTVDVDGTERLLEAAEAAGVSNVVYVSIVGIDDIPYSYYEHKLAAERAVEASDVPATILRATQFHQFVDDILGSMARLPVWPLATKFRIQPVDAREVADAIVDYASPEASGRVPPVGGPEVHTAGELAKAYRDARELRRFVLPVPLPGAVASAFRAGKATCPDRAVGTVAWADWLAERYGRGAETTARPAGSPSR